MSNEKLPMAKIWEAIASGDVERTRSLLAQHPDQIDTVIPFGGGTFLHFAASKGNVEMVRSLIDIGFDINKATADGETALATASAYGNFAVAKHLLDNGAHVHAESPTADPLFAAIVGQAADIAQLLLERGADSAIRYTGESMKAMDATAFALERGEREIAAIIAKWNAKGDASKADQLVREAMEVALSNNRAG